MFDSVTFLGEKTRVATKCPTEMGLLINQRRYVLALYPEVAANPMANDVFDIVKLMLNGRWYDFLNNSS